MKSIVTPDFTTMFDEAQKQLDRQFKSFTGLRKYAESLMGIASVIVSFFATFKVFDPSITKPISFYFLFFYIAILYTILMIIAINASRPSSIQSPIQADLKNYNEAYADKSEVDIIMSQITIYVRAIQENEKTLIKQEWFSKVMGWYLCAIVVLILFATGILMA